MRKNDLFFKKISIIASVAAMSVSSLFVSGCLSDDVKVSQDVYTYDADSGPETGSNLTELAACIGDTNTVLDILLKNTYDETAQKFILYISGIDVWGWKDTTSRSDVNLLLAVDRTNGKIQMVNTPRDSFVYLPNSGEMKDKLTHAGLYGVDSSKGALENLYGIKIDYYLKLNFSGFEKFVDTIGGIDVYSEQDFIVNPIKHYVNGINHLTGLESLAFVRERKSFSDGDYQRGRHQMEMAKAVIRALSSDKTLAKLDDYLDELKDFYNTDMPDELIKSIARTEMIKQRDWEFETFTTKGTGGSEITFSMPSQSVYVTVLNESDVKEAGELLNNTVAR